MSSSLCMLLVLVIQVNESDRQHIAATQSSPVGPAYEQTNAPVVGQSLIKKAIDGVSSVGDALSQVQKFGVAGDEKSTPAPAAVVWVRMSKGYLADYMERPVDRRKPVRDLILGTTIDGESHTTGSTRLVLYPNDRRALGEVEFVGEVHAKTVGHNGQATLQYLSDSTFRARKQITIDESGLSALPAVAGAPTRLTATSIQTSLPGLRGRIAQRIAWRRVARSQSEADAIASDHTADDIRRDLDRKINESIAAIQTKVQSQIAALLPDGEGRSMVMRSRSTPDYIEVALSRRGENENEVQMASFAVDGKPDIAVRVHRTILARALTNREIRETFAPMLGNAFPTQLVATRDVPESKDAGLKSSSWSMAGDWLTIDFTATAREAPPPRVAVKEEVQGQRTK